jgi:hypothetical protein
LDRRLGGPQRRSGRGVKEKNSQFLPELEPPITDSEAQGYTTELLRLQMKGGVNILERNHILTELEMTFQKISGGSMLKEQKKTASQ